MRVVVTMTSLSHLSPGTLGMFSASANAIAPRRPANHMANCILCVIFFLRPRFASRLEHAQCQWFTKDTNANARALASNGEATPQRGDIGSSTNEASQNGEDGEGDIPPAKGKAE